MSSSPRPETTAGPSEPVRGEDARTSTPRASGALLALADPGAAAETSEAIVTDTPAARNAAGGGGPRKRDRASALESGGTTPSGHAYDEDRRLGAASPSTSGLTTPAAKKGRVGGSLGPDDALATEPVEPEPEHAGAEADMDTPPPASPPLPPSREVQETARAVNTLRGAVSNLSTAEQAAAASAVVEGTTDAAMASETVAAAPSPTASTMSGARTPGPPADPSVPDVPMGDPEAPIPIHVAVSIAPASPPAAASVVAVKAASSSPPPPTSKPIGGFASFSSAASPFASVPTGSSSRGAFGGRSGSPASLPPLSRPNLAALGASTGAPPSPSASIRAEAGSVVPSRQGSPSVERETTPVPPPALASEQPKEPPPTPANAPVPLPAASGVFSPGAVSRTLEDEPSAAAAPAVPPSAFASFKSGFSAPAGKSTPTKGGGFGAFSTGASPFARSASTASADATAGTSGDAVGKGKRTFGSLSGGEGASTSSAFAGGGGGSIVEETDVEGPERKVFKEQAVVTGEEDDDVAHSVRAKLYMLDDATWKERGAGTIRLLRGAASDRLVMRNDATHRLCLNVALFGGMVVAVHQDKYVRFTAIEDAKDLVSYMIRVGNNQAAETFRRIVADGVARLAADSAPPAAAEPAV